MDFHHLLKVELHPHLDCKLSYEGVKKIDYSVTESACRRNFIAPKKCEDLAVFSTRVVKGFALV